MINDICKNNFYDAKRVQTSKIRLPWKIEKNKKGYDGFGLEKGKTTPNYLTSLSPCPGAKTANWKLIHARHHPRTPEPTAISAFQRKGECLRGMSGGGRGDRAAWKAFNHIFSLIYFSFLFVILCMEALCLLYYLFVDGKHGDVLQLLLSLTASES